MTENEKFSIFTNTIIDENTLKWSHWSEGLKMYITKNGVTIKLESEEIEQLVKTLPRTFGGTY